MSPAAPSSFAALARSQGRRPPDGERPVVAVQGLGFVGAAMAVAVAAARDGATGSPCFDVAAVDLPTAAGRAKVEALNDGRLPFASADPDLAAALADAHRTGNLLATTDPSVYELASVAVVDVPLDLLGAGDDREAGPAGATAPSVGWRPFRAAVRTLGERLPPGALVLVETTVPPGTCERVVAPELAAALERRGLPADALRLAHSYERVMPGEAYFASIVRFWRVYAGATPAAADACERFLSQVIDVESFPLSRLASTTASETAKVLENAYRAVNIAFIEEWGRFAEASGVDLFEVIAAIRRRDTHANLRQPGFGVGGYCLTKDPLFGEIGARELLGLELDFPFSRQAVTVNRRMPTVTLDHVERLLGGPLAGRRLLLLGVTYRPGVSDTRDSASADFVRQAEARGAEVAVHDPLVGRWEELGRELPQELPSPAGFDAVVLAVAHPEYRRLDLAGWLDGAPALVFDANDVLTAAQRRDAEVAGVRLASIGRGMPR